MIALPATYTQSCGGPSITIAQDGGIDVAGYGRITRDWKVNVDKWRALISAAAAQYGVPEAWIASVIRQESGGNPNAASSDGGMGLMQITNASLMHGHAKSDFLDPALNINTGAQYLAKLGAMCSWNPVCVAARYNSGGVYCWTGRNCASAGMWNLNTACSYAENIVRGINTAIARGYSGTGANASSSAASGALVGVLACAGSLAAFFAWRRYL